ncbi:hypothetical protein HF521_016678 [Silurus meridionalis]|uniref:Little elongation complex subunit 1 C-terminal domain-containing protein n=1 Tax=Silurus meridionalis TaxID=175797 RepID=A0A8T0BS26_SILME|nr:hypothetical protein HF521_016678 [Silurus meridionalis]
MRNAPPRINATDVTANRLNNVIRFQLNPDVYDVIAIRQNRNIRPRRMVTSPQSKYQNNPFGFHVQHLHHTANRSSRSLPHLSPEQNYNNELSRRSNSNCTIDTLELTHDSEYDSFTPSQKVEPNKENTPAVDTVPAVEELTTVDEKPASPQVPAVEQSPAPPHVPAVEQSPAPPHVPAVEQSPAPPHVPAVEQSPAPPHVPAEEHHVPDVQDEPPEKIYSTITSTLKALLEDSSLTFQKNSWYGDDLCPAAWDYVFSLDLLCAQLGWTWTYKNMLGNDIWQTLDTLLLQTRTEQTPYRNVSVAAVFRLLGRLGQLGLKKNMAVSVRNLLKGIHEFGNRKLSKDLPWEVQLAMVYATHDLAPSNPKVALKTVESWRQKIRQPVPLAVTKCLEQIGFLCHQNN